MEHVYYWNYTVFYKDYILESDTLQTTIFTINKIGLFLNYNWSNTYMKKSYLRPINVHQKTSLFNGNLIMK